MKDFLSKLLNGMTIAIVVALIPNALLSELLKLIISSIPSLQHLFDATVVVISMFPILIGILVRKESPYSAGFGLSRLVGPLNCMNLAEGGWTVKKFSIMLSMFLILSFILNLFFIYLKRN